MKKYLFVLLLAFSVAGCSVTGDRQVDAMIDKMGIEIIHDIPINDNTKAGKHIDNTIHMKARSFYPDKQQYLLVLLHEIAHHIGYLNKRVSYQLYSQSDYRLLEELIANKYATTMMKKFGYKLRFNYDKLNKEYMNELTTQHGYSKERVNQYVNAELKRCLQTSNRLLKRRI